MSELHLGCDCGVVSGTLSNLTAGSAIRLACYCDDCQAFAEELGRTADVLDAYGGTDIVQGTLSQLTISEGREQLRSLRLTPKGILRWYTACCKTPIANTVSTKMPFVGVIRRFIKDDGADALVGPVRYRMFGRFAKDPPASLDIHPRAPAAYLLRVAPKLIGAALRGDGRDSVFFASDGTPSSTPTIVNDTP